IVAMKLRGSSSDYHATALRRKLGDKTPMQWKAAAYVPPFLSALGLPPAIGTTPQIVPAVIFLHERTSPSGHRRLVSVCYWTERETFQPQLIEGYNCDATVAIPATIVAKPKAIPQMWALDVISGWPKHPPNVRIFAGQVDPKDESKFTIRYEMW